MTGTERYIGMRIDDIPPEYDASAVERALEAKPSKRSKRVPWSECEDLDDSDDDHPGWSGHPDLADVISAGRCGAPLPSSVRRFGEVRYCTRLPLRRMGKANWQTGSDFCSHHCELERKAIPAQEVFDLHSSEPLPYDTLL